MGFLGEVLVGRSPPGRGTGTCKVPRRSGNREGSTVTSVKPYILWGIPLTCRFWSGRGRFQNCISNQLPGMQVVLWATLGEAIEGPELILSHC